MSSELYQFSVQTLSGKPVSLDAYKGKVLLIVNTASKCGFTPQYEGLEKLHQQYKDRGLMVLGFPCNQFGGQEPGEAAQIQEFCQANYGVSFPMHAKVEVNGEQAHPLFRFLKHEAKGVLGTEAIKWNFTKFLVDKNGRVINRYAPATKPEELSRDIEALLA